MEFLTDPKHSCSKGVGHHCSGCMKRALKDCMYEDIDRESEEDGDLYVSSPIPNHGKPSAYPIALHL